MTIFLILLALAVRCLSADAKMALGGEIDGLLRGHGVGKEKEKLIAVALAGRHFGRHGAKWPSPAFVAAAHAATMRVPLGPPSGSSSSGSQGQGSQGTAPINYRMVVLMAMANDVALRSTVPTFIQSLRDVPVNDALLDVGGGRGIIPRASPDSPSRRPLGEAGAGRERRGGRSSSSVALLAASTAGGEGAGGSLADHIVLACSSATAVDLCLGLGLRERCEFGPRMNSKC